MESLLRRHAEQTGFIANRHIRRPGQQDQRLRVDDAGEPESFDEVGWRMGLVVRACVRNRYTADLVVRAKTL